MKAYPLIYSRTKNEDYVPDFLARPHDLDVAEALKYMHSAMEGLDTLNAIRYTAFSVGNYCICGGIACISKLLVQKVRNLAPAVPMEGVEEYLTDCKGRSLACFIGFAIPRPEVRGNTIPDIALEEYWQTYLTYLKHQWANADTRSEQLTEPEIELREKTYSPLFQPKAEMIAGKNAIRHFEQDAQKILDYYFDQHLNHRNADASFISDILYRLEWDRLHFKNAAVSETLYRSLKQVAEKSLVIAEETSMNQSVTGKVLEQLNHSPTQDESSSRTEDKKKTGCLLPLLVACCIILAIIAMLY